VFTAQTVCDFAGHTTEDFALDVNHEPVTFDFMRLGHKCLHDGILKFAHRDDPAKRLIHREHLCKISCPNEKYALAKALLTARAWKRALEISQGKREFLQESLLFYNKKRMLAK
jgi:hypothetical protein